MNRIGAILFLGIWLFNLMNIQFLFYREKSNWHSLQLAEIRQQIPISLSVVLEIDSKEYSRQKESIEIDKEIFKSGSYYDIIAIQKKGSRFKIKCLEDNREKVLLAKYVKDSTKKSKETSKTFKCNVNDYFCSESLVFSAECSYPVQHEQGRISKFWKESKTTKNAFPPPQCV